MVSAPNEESAIARLLQRRPAARGVHGAVRVAVVDYGSGNLASASRALALAADRLGLAAEIAVTADPAQVARADRIVLPGQGAFADCTRGLAASPGCARRSRPRRAGIPFFGICVGMQLMAERGLEHEITPGFGWIAGEIAPMEAPGLRLPQMGWNALDFEPGNASAARWREPRATMPISSIATRFRAEGGTRFLRPRITAARLSRSSASGNRAGTQFHVEKSRTVGIRILMNFLRWMP